MAIPFPIFEHGKLMDGYNRYGWIWCVRCEDWIPWEAAFGGAGSASDPHVADHMAAHQLMRNIDRRATASTEFRAK